MGHLSPWLVMTLLSVALGRPGMLTWVCKSCANANMVYNAEAEMRTGDGSVIGQLRLLQSIPRDQADNTVKGPVMIDTVDNRDRLEGLKTFSYSVQLQKGSCDNLGEVVASQYCSNCANSLGVALIKDKEGEEVVLSSLADTHSIVFFDTKINQSKLGCGEIRNGNVNTQG